MPKLAINGGNKLRIKDFPKWPQYGENEEIALKQALKSGVWGYFGKEVKQFTEKFAKYQHANYGLAVTNGTVSLEVILRALGIGYGDEVIIPPYTFNATASAVLVLGATPVFVDIEDGTYNIDPDKIAEAITPATKAIIPVHVGGRACDMDKIMSIAKKHNLYVVEDCAHAHGSEWDGTRVGSIGHAGSFSFQGSKNLNSGEGGFITVNDEAIFEKCWSVHNCGRDYNGTIWYEHVNIGTNARMTEWQAAILNVQMESLDRQIERRMENAEYLNLRLKELHCFETLKYDQRVNRNSYHLFIFKYKSANCKNLPREKFISALNAEGISCSEGYTCLYRQQLFCTDEIRRVTASKIDYRNIYLKTAETSEQEGVWIPQNVLLGTKDDMDDIIKAIIKVYENVDELL